MKKTILVGLAALTMNCAAPQIAGVAPWQAENSSRESFLYRGIEIEGLGWRTTKIMQALNLIYYRDPQNWLAVKKTSKKTLQSSLQECGFTAVFLTLSYVS